MNPLRVPSIQAILAAFWLLGPLSAGIASAQTPQPATLRLTQVIPRLPVLNFYAIAEDQNGIPVDPRSAEFSALVGTNNVPVKLSGTAEGIAIVFLVDVSASLSAQQFGWIKADVLAWINALGPNDRAAIVTLGSHVRTVQDFTADKQALSDAMQPLGPHDQQTLLYQGLVQAIDLSRRLDASLPLRRAIVTLTDGMDDQKNGAGRQEVIDKLALDPTPIYGIGASAAKDRRVDQALKDFAALVRMSGGDFRSVNLQNLDRTYSELRQIVGATIHLTASCSPCAPDGTATVVRLLMTDGPQRLSSEGVNVRMVGADGRVQTNPPPPPPEPAPAPAAALSSVVTPKPPPAEPAHSGWTFNVNLKFLLNSPLQWLAVLALMVGGTSVVVYRVIYPPSKPNQRPDSTVPANGTNVTTSPRVSVRPGTQQDKCRLRLYPIGHNDLEPMDVLFQDRLTVGRSPDSDICISNDSQVSAVHCALSPKDHLILVQDEKSRNGTRLNGVPVSDFLHAETDTILGVGRTELRMRVLEPQVP